MRNQKPYKQRIKHAVETFHELLHLLIGMVVAGIFHTLMPELSTTKLFFVAILGSLAPDLDHFLYYFIYGKNTEYSIQVRKFLKNREIRKYFSFCVNNHKKNTGLYSHNIISVLAVVFLSFWALNQERGFTTIFFVSWTLHYVFDIFEDVIFLRKLNPNWLLKFNRAVEDLYTGTPKPTR